jgi:hypothetical protein
VALENSASANRVRPIRGAALGIDTGIWNPIHLWHGGILDSKPLEDCSNITVAGCLVDKFRQFFNLLFDIGGRRHGKLECTERLSLAGRPCEETLCEEETLRRKVR